MHPSNMPPEEMAMEAILLGDAVLQQIGWALPRADFNPKKSRLFGWWITDTGEVESERWQPVFILKEYIPNGQDGRSGEDGTSRGR